jgi:cell wall-associated NlpC family hydrolase
MLISRRLAGRVVAGLAAAVAFLHLVGCASGTDPQDLNGDAALEEPPMFQNSAAAEAAMAIKAANPQRQRVIQTAYALIGTPYRYGGNGLGGIDCSALVKLSYRDAGLEVPRTARELFAASQRIAARQLKPGDLLFFTPHGSQVSHVGIYLSGDTFIHASPSRGQVSMSSLSLPYWQRSWAGAGTLLGNGSQAQLYAVRTR